MDELNDMDKYYNTKVDHFYRDRI